MPVVKPTMREKQRYILFKVEAEAPVSEEQVKRAAYGAVLSFLGEYGSSLANPKFIGFRESEGLAVLKCSHTEVEKIKAALALCNSVEGRRAAFRLRKVSGTIAGLSR